MRGLRARKLLLASALVAAALACGGAKGAALGGWSTAAPLPVPRGEVAAAVLGGEIVVVGGFVADGRSSARVDAYSPKLDRWRRLPDLPVAVNHAMATAGQGRLYVVGGFGGDRTVLRSAFVLEGRTWRRLRPMPQGRGAGGAALVGTRLYVVGGRSASGLARDMLVLDLRTGRWSRGPGPTPREHVGVAATGGRLYAVGGRLAGIDTNLAVAEAYTPAARRWRALPAVPEPRGGTGLAAAASLFSVGGEEPGGTIGSVYRLRLTSRRWERLPDLPTPRHGLAVAVVGSRLYAVAGGTEPGLAVSGTNEVLDLGSG